MATYDVLAKIDNGEGGSKEWTIQASNETEALRMATDQAETWAQAGDWFHPGTCRVTVQLGPVESDEWTCETTVTVDVRPREEGR